ncbi:TPA: 1,4-dihydroxy-2-naphthoate octaprenyltransferase [Candidatus Poribacteria bacterium]|nr:1,4-dihydroxy-2-naphthoate octaprenyltransferase [Candidatus Poribacteria bacterium]
MNRWIRALRVPFFTASAIPVLLGAAVAYGQTGEISVWDLILTLAGVIALHAGTNLANDYFDHLSGNDDLNPNPTPFSGGSRVIQEGLISPKGILIYSLSWFVLGCLIGLYLNWRHSGNVILYLGLIGVFSGFFYTAVPIRFGYHGLGEVMVGLNFGTLVVLGSYYVQTGSLSWRPVIASVPVSLLIAAVLWINEFPDYAPDAAAGKRTLVVRLGLRRSAYVYLGMLALSYIWLIFIPIPWGAIALATLPIAIKGVKVALSRYEDPMNLIPANAATVMLHLSFGLALCLAYLLERIV